MKSSKWVGGFVCLWVIACGKQAAPPASPTSAAAAPAGVGTYAETSSVSTIAPPDNPAIGGLTLSHQDTLYAATVASPTPNLYTLSVPLPVSAQRTVDCIITVRADAQALSFHDGTCVSALLTESCTRVLTVADVSGSFGDNGNLTIDGTGFFADTGCAIGSSEQSTPIQIHVDASKT